MGNRIGANADGSTTTHEENTKNYEISKSEDKTIKAPGDVERLTVSVILDGTLDNATRSSVTNAVSSAVGFDQRRGDTISVEGLTFDTSNQDKINKDLEEMKKEEERLKRNKLYTIIGAAVAIALIALIIFLIKRKKRNEELDELEPQGIDVVIDDEVPVEEKPKFKPIELDVEDEKSHVEKEIRKYASDKPDQVAEIIKSWLAEDER